MDNINWQDLKLFLAVSRCGTFSAAGERLGISQSTISRRVAALERSLQARLFERGAAGILPTAAGRELTAFASRMEEEALQVDRRVAGRDTQLSGSLRITAVDMMLDRYLAPHLKQFSKAHPDISLELVSPFQPLDLSRREADIALRASVEPPETLVGRRLFPFALAPYGAISLARKLDEGQNLEELDWIGWARDDLQSKVLAQSFPGAKIRHRVDSLLVASALVRQGLGIALLPCYWADQENRIRRLTQSPLGLPDLGLWILMHPDMRRAARVRAFVDFITERLIRDRDRFTGQE